VDAVQDVRLLVEAGLGGGEVLGSLVLVEQLACAEADDRTGDVADRPDEPAAEAVVDAALALADEPGGNELRLGEAAALQVAHQCVPSGGREAETERLGVVAAEAALGEERPRGLRPGGEELVGVELRGDAVGLDEPLPPSRLLPGS